MKVQGKMVWPLMAAAVLMTACGGGGGDSGGSGVQDPGSGTNAPPSIQGQPITSVVAGQSYSFRPSASDPNGDQLTFSATNLPSWATFNASTGAMSGTPSGADVGTYNGITITASDGKASASLAAFAITVSDVGNGSATISWTPPTQNTDGSSLTNLAGYQILYGRTPSDLTQTINLTNPSLSTYVVDSLATGTWYFAVASVNAQGVSSVLSNVASKTI